MENNTFAGKNKIVVDIRGLNKISEIDVYPMFFQIKIISAVFKTKYSSVINYAGLSMAGQIFWPTYIDRGWNVTVIKFKNNFAYVQKQIDGLLKLFKFAKTYVDDS